MPLEE